MAFLRVVVFCTVMVMISAKKDKTPSVDPEEVNGLKDLLLTSMQSIVSLDELATDLSDKVARLTTTMAETRTFVLQLKSSVVSSVGKLTTAQEEVKQDLEQTKTLVGNLQSEQNLTEIAEQVKLLAVGLEETKAALAGVGGEVAVVAGEEDAGNAKCVKVCAGTTGRSSTNWSNYHTNGLVLDVDIRDCGFVKVPTITTSIEGKGYHWRATGTSAVYSATAQGFRMYLEGGREHGHNPKNGKAAEWKWNVDWIAVGYTC